jgi:chemotaxis protein MotB
LSTDRANASRRLMQQHGLRSDQVAQVRGFADQEPRDKLLPSDPSNRRITLIVKYLEQKSAPDNAVGDPAKTLPVLGAQGGKTPGPVTIPEPPAKK